MFAEKIHDLTFLSLVEEFSQHFTCNCFEAITVQYCKLHSTSTAKNG